MNEATMKEIINAYDSKRINEAASICYLVREYCADEHNEFFNPAIVADAMEAVHDLLTYGESL